MNRTEDAQPISATMPHESRIRANEISLFDLLGILIQKKWIIIIASVVATALAFSYTLSIKSVYKAEANFLPPTSNGIQPLQIDAQPLQADARDRVKTTNADEAFSLFKEKLISDTTKREFFESNDIYSKMFTDAENRPSTNTAFQIFSSIFTVDTAQNSASITWKDPTQAAQWVNLYLEMTDRQTSKEIAADKRNSLKKRITDVENKISHLRKKAHQERAAEIARLEEAYLIASTLGYIERQTTNNIFVNGNMVAPLLVSPLYYRGTKELAAEAKILRQRKNDDPFIRDLLDHQKELTDLRNVRIDESLLHSVSVIRPAYPPANRVDTKNSMIIALGLLLGLMIGIFSAIIIGFFQIQGNKIPNNNSDK